MQRENKDELLAIHHAWIDAELTGNYRQLIDLCSKDIEFFPPDGPSIQGKDAVREFLQSGNYSIRDVQISNLRIETGGELAYKRASFVTRLQASPDGDVTTIRGNHLWILRQEGSQWRVLAVAWSVW